MQHDDDGEGEIGGQRRTLRCSASSPPAEAPRATTPGGPAPGLFVIWAPYPLDVGLGGIARAAKSATRTRRERSHQAWRA